MALTSRFLSHWTHRPFALRNEARVRNVVHVRAHLSKCECSPPAAVSSPIGVGFAGLLRARLHTKGPPAVAVCIVSVISRFLSLFSVIVLISRYLCACVATV